MVECASILAAQPEEVIVKYGKYNAGNGREEKGARLFLR
jgi:hypothetical protein